MRHPFYIPAPGIVRALPPHDLLAEEAVLGCLLLDGEQVARLTLEPGDFYREQNGLVLRAMVALHKRGEPINIITVAAELGENLEKCGGNAYLAQLVEAAPTPFEVGHYTGLVARCAQARRLIEAGGEIASIGYSAGADTAAGISQARRLLDKLDSGQGDHQGTPQDLATGVESWLKPLPGQALHLPWGSVEELTGPLLGGEYWLVGARTTVGKTTLLLSIALSLCRAGKTVLYMSGEEDNTKIGLRLAAMLTGLNIGAVIRGTMSAEDEKLLLDASGQIAGFKLWSPPLRGLSSLDRWLHRLPGLAGEPVDCALVDYFQLLLPRAESRYEEATWTSQHLKALAEENGLPIIVASQFSREASRRGSGRPILSDLKESGSLENDADVILFLHRLIPEAFEPKSKVVDLAQTEVIVAKNRLLGRTGTVKLKWDGLYRTYQETED